MNLLRIVLALCLAGIAVQAGDQHIPKGFQTTPTLLDPIDISLEAVRLPERAGPGELLLTVAISDPEYADEELTITVVTENGLVYHGPDNWSTPGPGSASYTVKLSIEIPPDDTSSIRVQVGCERFSHFAWGYFVTTGSTLEHWHGRPNPGSYSVPEPPDTTTYSIRLDLRDKEHYEFFERYKEQLGSIEPTADSGFYLYRTTWEGVRDLLIEGFKLEPVDSIPNMPTRPPRVKPTRQHDSTTLRPHNKPGDLSGSSSASIWLEMPDGSSVPDGLPPGEQLTFHVGLNNSTGENMMGITNGFRVYSPDGATWAGTVGTGNTAPTV